MGGSDQWGNITTGTELVRRIESRESVCVNVSVDYKADGTKFGKSEGKYLVRCGRTHHTKFTNIG